MCDENKSVGNFDKKQNKLDLDALFPEKISIETSIGTLYVRNVFISDWGYLELEDAAEMGRVAIQRLCNRIQDKHDSSVLDDDDLSRLTDVDCQALAQAVAKQNRWRELPSGSGLKDLSELIKEEKQAMTDQHEKMIGNLRKSIGSSYSFLEKGALDKLQEQMAGIANIRSSLAGTEYFQGVARAEKSWQNSLSNMEKMDKASCGRNVGDLISQDERSKAYNRPEFIMPPRFEETAKGRAILESTDNSRQVAKKMDDLVVVVAGINQTLVQDVLPAWFKKIEEDQVAAKDAFDQAASGLRWTKWAVIASVFVTIVVTWWQVDIAKSIDRENSEQQIRVEAVLREQLVAQQKLIEQQAKDAAAMREVVETLKPQSLTAKP